MISTLFSSDSLVNLSSPLRYSYEDVAFEEPIAFTYFPESYQDYSPDTYFSCFTLCFISLALSMQSFRLTTLFLSFHYIFVYFHYILKFYYVIQTYIIWERLPSIVIHSMLATLTIPAAMLSFDV